METVNNVHIFGDSVMKGIVLNSESGRYQTLPDENFKKIEETFALRIFNRARFGCTVEKGKALLHRFLEKHRKEECDCVLLEFGGNDCNFNWAEVAAAPEEEHKPATILSKFSELLREMVNLLKKAGIRPVLMTLPPVDAEKYLAFLESQGLNAKNILRWLGDAQMIYRFQELYSSEVAALAEETGVHLVDVRRQFLDKSSFAYKNLLCDDGIHPTEEGHLLIYKAFRAYMHKEEVNGVPFQGE